VQFVGRAFDEATLLRVAAAYERATQWSRQRPALYQNIKRGEAVVTA
jgi:aspartyl-tRNA(Asn)/glutamyl-tRNA(Gln) amidotransferase subunit A